MLEKNIEKAVVKHANSLGYYTRKFTSAARRSVPDRIFINPKGFVFFIEFKALGRKPTIAQAHEHKMLTNNNSLVLVIDSVSDGIKVLEQYAGVSPQPRP